MYDDSGAVKNCSEIMLFLSKNVMLSYRYTVMLVGE